MPDELTTTPESTEQQPATPAGAPNTDTAAAEHMIPKSRFDEVSKRLRELEAQAKKIEAERQEQERKRLEETQNYQKLYETEQAKATTLEQQITELRESNRLAAIYSSIKDEATAAKFADPKDAITLIGLDEIEADEGGKPTNVKKLVEALAKSKPYLIAQRTPTPGSGASPMPAGVGTVDAQRRQEAALINVRQKF